MALVSAVSSGSTQVIQAVASGTLSVAAALKTVRLKPGMTVSISDTTANIQKNLDALQKITNNIGAIEQTDESTHLSLTQDQYQRAAGVLAKFSTDYSVDLDKVLAGSAGTLAADTHVLTLSVVDTSVHVATQLDALNGNTKLSRITQTGATAPLSLTPAQVAGNTVALGKIRGPYTLAVTGATVSEALSYASNAKVKFVSILDTGAHIANDLDALKALGVRLKEIRTDAPATLDINASQVKADAQVLGKIISGFHLAVHLASSRDFTSLQANTKVISIDVKDTAANVSKSLDLFQKLNTHLQSVEVTDASPIAIKSDQLLLDQGVIGKLKAGYTLAVSGASAAEAVALQGDSTVTSIQVVDTAANVSANLVTLSGLDKLDQIVQTGNARPFDLSIDQYQNSDVATTLGKIAGRYSVSLSQVAMSQLASVTGESAVTSIAILDTAANLATQLSDLSVLGKRLTTITQSDAGTALDLSYAQFSGQAGVLNKIQGGYSATVSGAPVKHAQALANDNHVVSLTVKDSGAVLQAQLGLLMGLGDQLTGIEQSDTADLVMTAQQLNVHQSVLDKFSTDYTLDLREVAAADAATLAENTAVIKLSVVDSGDQIATYFDDLAANDLLVSVTQTTPTSPLAITAAQFDAGTDLLANIKGRYSVALSEVSASDVARLAALKTVSTLKVSATAAAIGTNLGALHQAGKKLASITQTDAGPIAITYSQFKNNTPTLDKIVGGYGLDVSAVSAANAATVAANGRVNTLSVTDSGLAIARNLDALQNLGTQLRALTQSDSAALGISHSQLVADSGALALLSSYTLSVTGASVSAALTLASDDTVTSISVTDSGQQIAQHLADLNTNTKLLSIWPTDPASAITLSASALSANSTAIGKIKGTYSLSVTNASATGARDIASNRQVASITVLDDASDIVASLGDLNSLGRKLTGITQSDDQTLALTADQFTRSTLTLNKIDGGYNADVTNALASQAGKIGADSHVATLTVADDGARLAYYLDTLQGLGIKLTQITNTDSADLTLTPRQLNADSDTLGKFVGSYTVNITGATVSELTALESDSHVATISVMDSAAALATQLDTLGSDALVTQLSLSDTSQALSLSATQYSNGTAGLAKIQGNYQIEVSDVPAADASTLASDSHVSTLQVTDTAAHIAANLATLSGLTKLDTLQLSDPTTPLALTTTELSTHASLLDKIQGNYSLSISGVSMTELPDLLDNSHVSALEISDTSAAVSAGFDTLQTLGSALVSVTLSDTSAALDLSNEQWLTGQDVLGTVAGDYLVNINGVSAQSVSDLVGNTHVGTMIVNDTAENIANRFDALNSHVDRLTALYVNDSAPVQISAAQYDASADLRAKFTGAVDFSVLP